jgi:hypothetical protein
MTQPEPPGASDAMRRSYLRVLIVWAVTLAALYVFPKLFS